MKLGSGTPWFSLDCNAGEPELAEDSDSEAPETVLAAASSADTRVDEEAPRFVAVAEEVLHKHRKRKTVISTTSSEVVRGVIERLEGIWAVYEPTISEELIVSEAAPVDGITSSSRIKHVVQNESIIQHLRFAEMWNSKALYVEWGSGNAFLSTQLQQQLHSDHILIDRKNPKTKVDYKRDLNQLWKRLTIDIKDVALDAIPEVSQPFPVSSSTNLASNADSSSSTPAEEQQSRPRSVYSFSKHLCGAATDLTIRCLEQHKSAAGDDALMVALCCHHQCTWRSYVGRTFFEDVLGLDREDFDIITRMSSWATSTDLAHASPASSESLESGDHGLTREEKRLWGWRCKRLLDVGRAHYLSTMGYTTHFRYYVPSAVSPENILLVARQSSPTNAEASESS